MPADIAQTTGQEPVVLFRTDLPYVFRWEREGRKGQTCYVLARGKMNSCLVEFADGFRMVTSRNAIRKNRNLPSRQNRA